MRMHLCFSRDCKTFFVYVKINDSYLGQSISEYLVMYDVKYEVDRWIECKHEVSNVDDIFNVVVCLTSWHFHISKTASQNFVYISNNGKALAEYKNHYNGNENPCLSMVITCKRGVIALRLVHFIEEISYSNKILIC